MEGFRNKFKYCCSLQYLGPAKRYVVAVIGFTVLLVGVALLVLPGPAVVVIPLGLAILASEFLWARRLLDRVKHTAHSTRERFRRKPVGTGVPRPVTEP
jgi:uncharacterized protein (TIGR02611 family)